MANMRHGLIFCLRCDVWRSTGDIRVCFQTQHPTDYKNSWSVIKTRLLFQTARSSWLLTYNWFKTDLPRWTSVLYAMSSSSSILFLAHPGSGSGLGNNGYTRKMSLEKNVADGRTGSSFRSSHGNSLVKYGVTFDKNVTFICLLWINFPTHRHYKMTHFNIR